MSKKINYYLIVSADNIYSKIIEDNNVIADNFHTKEIFNKYGIPMKFQKMIFKVSIGNMTQSKNAFELITNESFCFKTPFLEILINSLSNPVIEMLSQDIRIVTENRLFHSEDIKEFYQSIIDNKLALNYQKAIKEILKIDKEPILNGVFMKTKKKK